MSLDFVSLVLYSANFLGQFVDLSEIITIRLDLEGRGCGVASLLLTFDDRRKPDDPLNSSRHNRYLTVFFACRPDGDINVLAERN